MTVLDGLRPVASARLIPRVPLCLPVARQVYRFHLRRLVAETKIKPHVLALWLNTDYLIARDLLRGSPLLRSEEVKVLCAKLERNDCLPLLESLLRAAWHQSVKPPRPVGPGGTGLVTGLEAFAEGVTVYDPLTVPAQLQTQMYAAALTKQDSVAANVTREQRAAPLANDHDPLPFCWITTEQAIRRRLGNPAVMDDQRTHLADICRRPTVTIRVVPAHISGTPSLPFELIDGVPPVVVVLDKDGLHISHDTDTVASYRRMVERLEALALSPEDSRQLIQEVSG